MRATERISIDGLMQSRVFNLLWELHQLQAAWKVLGYGWKLNVIVVLDVYRIAKNAREYAFK
jgi:hypothetical protein